MQDAITLDLNRKRIEGHGHGLDSSVSGCFEYSNKSSGSIKCGDLTTDELIAS